MTQTKEVWNFIDTGIHDAAINMAIDEALLKWQSEGKIAPTLRFYRWEKPSLTVGHFQNVDKTIHFEGVEKHQCDFVRRITGGSAVLHDDELTYSIVISETHPKVPKTVNESYFILAQGILQGYRNLEIEAEFSMPNIKDRNRSAVCFETPAIYEMIIDGKKLSGNAQTRRNGVLLQHGSIPFSFDVDMLFDLFKFSTEKNRERQKNKFQEKAICINDIKNRKYSYDEVSEAFLAGFKEGLHIETKPFTFSEEQWKYIHNLADTKYRTAEWNLARKPSIRSEAN